MNQKGTSAFFLLQMFVLFFILGMALAVPLTQTSNEAQDNSSASDGVDLDCNNASLSYQDRANCTSTDSLPWFYIATIFGFAGVIIAKIGGA